MGEERSEKKRAGEEIGEDERYERDGKGEMGEER